MPDVQSSTLRIYCLCGQKMRVSEKMYGLPGKCVACRQKIRIPRKEDVPEGVTDISLKDHPELVRGPAKVSMEEHAARKAMAKAGQGPESGEESTPNTELDLVDSPPPAEPPAKGNRKRPSSRGSLPLDVLPILQVLCSLEYKFGRQLDSLQLNSHEDEVLLAELEGHLARVRKLRSHLDDQLHQRLMETAIELANTQEKLAQARLSARVGDTAWGDYQQNVHRLRTRRDRLERRQQNLRGWLATRDPYAAGGLLDLSVDNIPQDGFTVTLPAESNDETPLLTELVEGLRAALEERARVRQRAAEVQRMRDKENGREIDELRKECEQQRLMARAAVAFIHDRLQQMKKDYTSDNETANAMLAGARDKLRMDAIARPDYDTFEREILRSKKDLARAHAVIDRALGANAAADVPSPQGTFMHRLGISSSRRNAPDMLLAYGAAVLLVLGIFTPALGQLSLASAALQYGSGGGPAAWLFLGPLVLAAAAGAITLVGNTRRRGWLYVTAGIAGALAVTYAIHESSYSLDPIAARFRSAAQWYLQPGIVLLLTGIVCVFAAAFVSLWKDRAARTRLMIATILGIFAVGLVDGDVAGVFRPKPSVTVEMRDGTTGVVRVSNSGGRSIRLMNRPTDARGTYQFFIGQRVGASSIKDVTGDGPLWDAKAAKAPEGVLYTVRPGAVQEVGFLLPPGDYLAVLQTESTHWDASTNPIVAGFTIHAAASAEPTTGASTAGAATPPAAAPSNGTGLTPSKPGAPVFEDENAATAAPADESASAGDATTEAAPDEDLPPRDSETTAAPLNPNGQPTVQLIGVVTTDNQQPRFSLRLYHPDGTEDRLVLAMGGVVWNDWTITEFNPDQNTVTLEGAGGLLILRRGVEVAFTEK